MFVPSFNGVVNFLLRSIDLRPTVCVEISPLTPGKRRATLPLQNPHALSPDLEYTNKGDVSARAVCLLHLRKNA